MMIVLEIMSMKKTTAASKSLPTSELRQMLGTPRKTLLKAKFDSGYEKYTIQAQNLVLTLVLLQVHKMPIQKNFLIFFSPRIVLPAEDVDDIEGTDAIENLTTELSRNLNVWYKGIQRLNHQPR